MSTVRVYTTSISEEDDSLRVTNQYGGGVYDVCENSPSPVNDFYSVPMGQDIDIFYYDNLDCELGP